MIDVSVEENVLRSVKMRSKATKKGVKYENSAKVC